MMAQRFVLIGFSALAKLAAESRNERNSLPTICEPNEVLSLCCFEVYSRLILREWSSTRKLLSYQA